MLDVIRERGPGRNHNPQILRELRAWYCLNHFLIVFLMVTGFLDCARYDISWHMCRGYCRSGEIL